MISKKDDYQEGIPQTNENTTYVWKGGIYSSGCGCQGFAFMLSYSCFGKKTEELKPFPTEYKFGEVIRINDDTHYIIILKNDLNNNTITIAEGNCNNSIYFGRAFTIEAYQVLFNYFHCVL